MNDLHGRLLAAHDRDDKPTLVNLYAEAAEAAASVDECAFFLTQAYVFALDAGHPDTRALRNRLVAMGRES